MSDSRAVLAEAGLDRLPEGMREVFDNLSPTELEVAAKIQERLNAVTPEIEGQADSVNCLC